MSLVLYSRRLVALLTVLRALFFVWLIVVCTARGAVNLTFEFYGDRAVAFIARENRPNKAAREVTNIK